MKRASDLKKGDVVALDGEPHIVETLTVQKPSARGAATLYKFRFRALRTKRKTDQTFRGDDVLEEAEVERHPVQYLFGDAASATVMDLEDYAQYTLPKDEIEDEWPYLYEGIEGLVAILSEGRVLGLELPLLLPMTIAETTPAVKGGSATSRFKPATMTTGLVVLVPEHLAAGDVIRVDTRTGQYASKA